MRKFCLLLVAVWAGSRNIRVAKALRWSQEPLVILGSLSRAPWENVVYAMTVTDPALHMKP